MMSFGDILGLMFLGVFGYIAYWIRHAVEIYEHSKYSDYRSYQHTIKQGKRQELKPERPQDTSSIRAITSDQAKTTVKTANGLLKTSDDLINLAEANPADVMAFIDNEVGDGVS